MRAREAAKGLALVLILVGMVSTIGLALPGPWTVWSLLVPFVGIVGGFGLFLRVHFAADRAPDYLHAACGEFFDRDGFCFAVRMRVDDGACVMQLYFQSRQSVPSHCAVALRAQGPGSPHVGFDFTCPPAGFGVVEVPAPVAPLLAGQMGVWQVGASVDYPQGRGETLRFRDGMVIRTNTRFKSLFGDVVLLGGLLMGEISILTNATVRARFPVDLSHQPAQFPPASMRVMWKLGDPPLGEIQPL